MAMYQVGYRSTDYPLVFLMVDATDHISGKTGLSPTVKLGKAGGTGASPSGSVTEIDATNEPGWYKVAGDATDSDTLGALVLHATASGADPTDAVYEVSHQPNLYGALEAGTAQAGGASTITLRSGASAVDDFFKAQAIMIISATGAGQTNQITGYDGATKVATVETAWVTQPDNTSVYLVLGRIG